MSTRASAYLSTPLRVAWLINHSPQGSQSVHSTAFKILIESIFFLFDSISI